MTDQLNEINTDSGCPKCGSPLVEKVKYTWWVALLALNYCTIQNVQNVNIASTAKRGNQIQQV